MISPWAVSIMERAHAIGIATADLAWADAARKRVRRVRPPCVRERVSESRAKPTSMRAPLANLWTSTGPIAGVLRARAWSKDPGD
jgi:hypothetical protein